MVILHDSFNPECREGMRTANWAANPQVHAVELDRAALAGDWAGLTPHLWWVLAYAAAALAAAVLLFLRQMKKQ